MLIARLQAPWGGFIAKMDDASPLLPSSSWYETGLQTTLSVWAGWGTYYDADLFLRVDHHTLAFIINEMITKLQVAYDGGGWQAVVDGVAGLPFHDNAFFVTPPWTGSGVYEMKMRWADELGHWSNHDYRVFVVPAADRVFADSDGNYMLLWQGGSVAMDKPLLVVEGFDPDNDDYASENFPERYYAGAIDFFRRLTRMVLMCLFSILTMGETIFWLMRKWCKMQYVISVA